VLAEVAPEPRFPDATADLQSAAQDAVGRLWDPAASADESSDDKVSPSATAFTLCRVPSATMAASADTVRPATGRS
jgi:hypothetical protein